MCINWPLLLCNMQQNYHKLVIVMYSKIQWMWINCNYCLCNFPPLILWETWNISHDVSGECGHYTIIGITIFNYSQRKFSHDDFLISESYSRQPTLQCWRDSIGILTKHDSTWLILNHGCIRQSSRSGSSGPFLACLHHPFFVSWTVQCQELGRCPIQGPQITC